VSSILLEGRNLARLGRERKGIRLCERRYYATELYKFKNADHPGLENKLKELICRGIRLRTRFGIDRILH
jgi:hypothetical protein